MAMHFKLYRDTAELPVGARTRLSLNLQRNDAVDDLSSPRECLEQLVAHLHEMLMGEAEPTAGGTCHVPAYGLLRPSDGTRERANTYNFISPCCACRRTASKSNPLGGLSGDTAAGSMLGAAQSAVTPVAKAAASGAVSGDKALGRYIQAKLRS